MADPEEVRRSAHGRPRGKSEWKKITFQYDREGDILYINKRSAYAEQDSEEIGDGVIARLNRATGEIENLEVLFFLDQAFRSELFELPVTADLGVLVHKTD